MDFGEKRYEGVNALSGPAFAVYETCRVDEIIKEAAGRGNPFPEPAIKAAVGGMMLPFGRIPFGRYRELYAGAPLDPVFGESVDITSLNGMAFARALDSLYETDMPSLVWKIADRCCGHYGLSSDVIHMDATNVSVYAIGENTCAEGISAGYGGNSKTNRNDLPRYDAMIMADGNRVLRYMRAYDGNTSDYAMNRDAVAFLKENADPKVSTVVGDSKIASREPVSSLIGSGFAFVTKCPENFSDKVREDIVYSVKHGYMDGSALGDGYGTYDTRADTVCGNLRFVGYRTPKNRSKSIAYYREHGERQIAKKILPLARKEFFCRDDALASFAQAVSGLKDNAYRISASAEEIKIPPKRKKRGRPPKNETEEYGSGWVLNIEYGFDEAEADRLAEENDIRVPVTDIPLADSNGEGHGSNIRGGAAADEIVRLYPDEYKPEHCYRILKSGMGMDRVHLHKGNRVAAMFCLCAIGGVVSSVMDEVLRRGNSEHTTYRLKLRLGGTTVRVKRRNGCPDYTFIDGPEGIGSGTEKLCGMLNVDPELMITGRK